MREELEAVVERKMEERTERVAIDNEDKLLGKTKVRAWNKLSWFKMYYV